MMRMKPNNKSNAFRRCRRHAGNRVGSRTLLVVILLLYTLGFSNTVSATSLKPYYYDGYTYDFWGDVKESPAMLRVSADISEANMDGIPLQSVDDVHYSDGLIYMADSVAARVNVFNEDLELVTSIKLMRDESGKIALDENGLQIMLKGPQGVFVFEPKQELYIADPVARSVFVLDSRSFVLKRVITTPDAMIGVTAFTPSKVTVDPAERIYLVVQGSYEGIIELNTDGSFSRFFGVNSPVVNLLDHFWKSIATDAQKEKMQKQYAPSFNNVSVDAEGFVFATTYDSNAADCIFRLNGKGENVLREEGNIPVMGDLFYMNLPATQFVDVSVTDYGVYAALDRARGRVFIYDYDGYLLNVFGNLGNTYGQFKTPVGIVWTDNGLLVADKGARRIYVYDKTEFGHAALNGSEAYHRGEWDQANEAFSEALKLNTNYDIAYIGMGKNYLMQSEYEEAMYYFEKGNARPYYSDAYNEYRTIALQKNFAWIFALIIAVLVVIFITEYRYHKKEGGN